MAGRWVRRGAGMRGPRRPPLLRLGESGELCSLSRKVPDVIISVRVRGKVRASVYAHTR